MIDNLSVYLSIFVPEQIVGPSVIDAVHMTCKPYSLYFSLVHSASIQMTGCRHRERRVLKSLSITSRLSRIRDAQLVTARFGGAEYPVNSGQGRVIREFPRLARAVAICPVTTHVSCVTRHVSQVVQETDGTLQKFRGSSSQTLHWHLRRDSEGQGQGWSFGQGCSNELLMRSLLAQHNLTVIMKISRAAV
ncbi:hypothetical protein BJY00DRAFT_294728 [Aspergillus carlsbadensis]|nr:hypothetical protein BJY00DRAFT_294728 [Aspergillus carlsbadensis]